MIKRFLYSVVLIVTGSAALEAEVGLPPVAIPATNVIQMRLILIPNLIQNFN